MMSRLLAGQRAIVTGGSGTIGMAISKALISQGASVVITGRNEDRLIRAQASLLEAHPEETVSILTCDVSDEASVVDFFCRVDSHMGECDLLINNAGIMAPGATVDLSGADFDKVMKINVLGPFLCSREALKRMKKRKRGRIINVGSLSAISPRPDSAPYTTSKFALLGLTKCLALDGRDFGVAVGIIHPGNVMSDLLSQEEVERREGAEGFVGPEDVANCVLSMATMPPNANILELTVLPTRQPFVGRG